MLVVSREAIGATAFARMVRDSVVHDVFGPVALPADVASTRALRAHLLAPFVPKHAWVTGLAALWIEGLAPPPPVLDLAGSRSRHRTPLPGDGPVTIYRGGPLTGLRPDAGSPSVATVTRACLDALAHDPAWAALPATASAVRTGATSLGELGKMAKGLEVHTHHRRRLLGLVEALGGA